MRRPGIANWICVLVFHLTLSASSSAQEVGCSEIHAIAKMSKSETTADLATWKDKAGSSYRAKSVFALRYFELHPQDRIAASAALEIIPKNEEQDVVWHPSPPLCHGESVQDELARSELDLRLPHDLAKAVLLVPEKMLDYVGYAYTSCGDPGSDYAVQMQAVCRSRHEDFLKAVDALPGDDKKWFLKSTFNPAECRALSFPEAE